MRVRIHTDGGSRGNPGPAAIGYVIEIEGGGDNWQEEIAVGKTIGEATNNIAEYEALIAALTAARELGATEVECYADSKLIVEQVKGNYKIKQPHLQQLYIKVHNLKSQFRKTSFTYIPREQNKRADALLNQAFDMIWEAWQRRQFWKQERMLK